MKVPSRRIEIAVAASLAMVAILVVVMLVLELATAVDALYPTVSSSGLA